MFALRLADGWVFCAKASASKENIGIDMTASVCIIRENPLGYGRPLS